MEANQWKTASEQLLKHWSRCGITQVPIGSPQEVDDAAEWLRANRTSIFEERLDTQASTPVVVDFLKSPEGSEIDIATNTIVREPTLFTTQDAPMLATEERQSALAALHERVNACRKCDSIVCYRQRTVFGSGNVHAKIVMFGEAPGADEDRVGEPFVGAAGQLLDKIIVASGLQRSQVYIMNALKCRPPNNRTPTEEEIGNCRPFFEQQLETIQPGYIVCWGSVAVRAVLGSTDSVGRLRGRFHNYRGAKVMVTYHPAYLLRTPDAKKHTWEDMKMLMREIGMPVP